MTTQLRVAVIGAGPAGIYAGNILARTGLDVTVDLYERLPVPYGLIRYGVAPDHPRIKGVVNSLHDMLGADHVRFFGNVTVGRDITVDELRRFYDAVILATGADADAGLSIPGIDLPGSHGAADFVSWYDAHPDVDPHWPLEDAREVAVIGNGNVALDIARVLAKRPLDMLKTDIPHAVHAGLERSAVTDVHIFGRRSPAHVKFTPLELRELGEVPGVDIVLDEEDFADVAAIDEVVASAGTNQTKVMVRTLRGWLARERTDADRRIHLHFFHSPVTVLGEDHVAGVRFERTAFGPGGTVVGTGRTIDYDVQALYRAVGYRSSAVPGVPFDDGARVIPNDGGRVLGAGGRPVPGLYTTGWVGRGPVGLIGHTKSDAQETIDLLVADAAVLARAAERDPDAPAAFLAERGVPVTTWEGWLELDAHERRLAEEGSWPVPRERVKVATRDEQLRVAHGVLAPVG